MEGLNRCPFCGGKAEIEGRKKIKAVCQDCGASSPIFDFRSQAVEYWNERAILKPFITYNVLDKLVQAVFDGIERYAKKQVEKKATEKKDENS